METQTEHFAGFRVNSSLQSCLWTDVWTHLPACLPSGMSAVSTNPAICRSIVSTASGKTLEMAILSWCVHRIWLFQRRAFLFPRSTGTARITINIYEALSSPWLVVFIQPTDQECLFTSLSDVHPFDIFIASAGSTSRPFLPRSCAIEACSIEEKREKREQEKEE